MPHCLVRGSIYVHEYYYVTRISRPGETISSRGFQNRMGGKGFNQAVALSLATRDNANEEGRKVSFYGTAGRDSAGESLKEKLLSVWGLDNDSLFLDLGEATGRAIIQVPDNEENSIVLFPGANQGELIEVLNKPWPPKTTHLLLQNEINLKSTIKVIESAEKLVTIFNPSPMLHQEEIIDFPWTKIDWLIVNRSEAELLLTALTRGATALSRDIKVNLQTLANQPVFNKTRIVCMLGIDGALAIGYGLSQLVFVEAARLEGPVAFTSGSEDTFIGYFTGELMSLSEKRQEIGEDDVVRMLTVATRAAVMCIEGTVDSMPTRDRVEKQFGVV